VSQLVLHRLLTVASKRCDGVVVEVLEVVEVAVLPSPPQEVREMLNDAKNRMRNLDCMLLACN